MVTRLIAIIMLPPLIAALITMMLMAPNGPVNAKFIVFMLMLVILTMTLKSIDLYREGKRVQRKIVKLGKPKVASDLGRTLALGLSGTLVLTMLGAGVIAPQLYYTMDLMSLIAMILVVLMLSTTIWYGVFPKPQKPKPQPAIAAQTAGLVTLIDGRTVPADSPEAQNPALTATPLLAAPASDIQIDDDEDILEIEEGESIEEIKKRLKPKKPKLDLALLDSGNSYDDKVALLRFLVSEDQQRVSQALKGMMSPRK